MVEVLVTGATGFIGRQLVSALKEEGHHVVALVRDPARSGPILGPAVELRTGDVLDPESLARSIGTAERVIHLASLLKMPWHEDFSTVNAQGTRNVAVACAARTTPPRLLFVSSLAAAGPSPADAPRDETNPAAPVSHYGRVKLEAEQAASTFADQVPLSIVRPPMVFGPHDRSALSLYRTAARRLHLVPTRADNRLSLIHVSDLARALSLVSARGQTVSPAGRPDQGLYYVAHDERPFYAELGLLIAAAMGWKPPRVVHLPFAVTWLAALSSETVARLSSRPTLLNLDKAREARAGSWICRADRLAAELGFRPASVTSRLRETGEWYLEHQWLEAPRG